MATVTESKRHLVITSSTYESSGDVTVGGDLFVNGAQTVVNTATLNVEDKNISLNYGGTEASSQGAGLTIVGSGATLLWDEANTRWALSDSLVVTDHVKMTSGNASGKFAVKSTDVHASYDFYNNGTTYLNNTLTVNGSVTGTQFKLNNNVTNTNADSFLVYSDGGSTAYGMTLWNTSGTSGEWATMIFGPNQASRRISFGKANGNFGTNHAGIDELAWLDLDNGNYFTDGNIYPGGSTTKYVSTGRIDNWQTAYGWGNHASAGYLTSLSGAVLTTGNQTITGVKNFTGELHWDLSSGEYAGDPRAVVMGYSGGNYGQLGYNIDFSTTSNTHTRVFNDIPTRMDLYDGILLYSSAAGSAGTSITWTELLQCQTNNFEYKGQDIYHTGNNSGILNSNITLSSLGAAAASHNHDDRYYTETEIDNFGFLTSSSTQSKYLRSDANDTATGKLTFAASFNDADGVSGGTGITPFRLSFQASNRPGSGNYFTGHEYTFSDTGARAQLGFGSDGNNTIPHIYARTEGWSGSDGWKDWYRIYHTGYHPEADEWTTARTITFAGGDVTGSFSIDGSADVSNVNLTVADDSHNHDGRYYTETEINDKFTSSNGSEDEWKFTLGDESSMSGNKWYKVATINQGSGGLHIKGSFSNHVESFGTQHIDLLLQGREDNNSSEIEITGRVDVLHNAGSGTDKVGIRVIEADDTSSQYYHYYDVYMRTTRYTQAKFHFTKWGGTGFHTSKPSVTSEPAPISGGSVELDTSSLLEGNYVVDDSTPREIYHEGHKPTLSELGAQASGNYITGTGSLSAQDLTDIGNLSGTNTGDQDLSGFLTSSSTQDKYLRSDTADTGTGTITLADSSASNNPLILGSSSQTGYTLQQFKTSAHGTNNAYLIAYGAGHGSQAGNFAMKNTLSGKNIFFEVNNAVPLKLENGTSTFTGNIVVSGTVDGRDISALPTTFAPTNAEANVQADWNETTTTSDAFILNKPTIPSGNQIIDWTAENAGTIHASNYVDNTGTSGISNVVEDTTPQLGGHLDMNGKYMYETNEATASIDLKDHSGYTWFRNSSNAWIFQSQGSGDDWTYSFALNLPATDSSFNNKLMELGQRQNNGSSGGKYKGVRIVKSTGSSNVQDGYLQAGTVYASYAIEMGDLGDTTLTRHSSGNVSIEGNKIWHAGGLNFTLSNGLTHDTTTGRLHADINYISTSGTNNYIELGSNSVGTAIPTSARISYKYPSNDNIVHFGEVDDLPFAATSHTHSNYITSNASDNVTGHTEWQDNYHVRLGNSADMRLYHTNGNSYIDNNTGSLYIRANVAGDVGGDIHLRPHDNENGIIIRDDNSVELYYDNGIKAQTTISGMSVTGSLLVSSSVGNLDTTNDIGQQLEKGDASTATLRCDADRWRVYMGGTSATGENLTVLQTGNVGIKDSTPSYRLDVSGTIRATGDVIAYSDERVKENIKTIDNSLEKVNKLRGVEFNKIGEDKKSIGVIAQEIEKVLPEVVRTDDEGMKSVAYGNVVGVLIEAIKELNKEVEELKNKLNNGN